MTLRIGWLSPLTPASGIGTFSHAIAALFPATIDGEAVDLSLLHPDHRDLHRSDRRTIRIEDSDSFRSVLGLFDVLVYNIGNNTEHHETIFRLLRSHPGIVVCHDYVYQHYLADRSLHAGRGFGSFAALLMKFGDKGAGRYLAQSRITSRLGKVRYSPWDSEASAAQPMSEAILDLGSALVVHSRFAEDHARKRFQGPILRLGMPHDQKPRKGRDTFKTWAAGISARSRLHMVSFGHIQSTKCIDLVIEAINGSKSLRGALRYTIAGFVGDWDYFRRLEAMIAGAGLHEVVRFETGVSEARLTELMGEADLFVNLRRPNTEGSSASLTEQLDSGRPVVVLDSGCYAEVPDDAVIKLAPEAGPGALRDLLETLVANPGRLPSIGRAGRAYARVWSCRNYGEHIVRFALEHRDLLSRRGRVLGVGDAAPALVAPDDALWATHLAQARAAMRYLDGNLLTLDPELVMSLPTDELCDYVAHVILGVFEDSRLRRALSRFFAGLSGRDIYWACARFFLLAEAVMGHDTTARQRLRILGPWYEPEFWDVVESLPWTPFVTAGALLLLGEPPSDDDLASCNGEGDAPGKRRVLLDILRRVPDTTQPSAIRLKRWLEQPAEHDMEGELPTIEGELECNVGTEYFRDHVDLSGFHMQEATHAWTRGARGFIGLRLGSNVQRIELVVRNVNAAPDRPAVVRLSSGTSQASIDIEDSALHALALAIPRHLARSDGTTWLQLSTSRAEHALGSADPRLLGVCLYRIMVRTEASDDTRCLADEERP